MPPALTAAIQTTLGTCRAQVERPVRQLDTLGRKAVPSLRRLLSTYGCQVSYDSVRSRATPRMLADPGHVNERRARIGLESIEDYLRRFEPPRP